MTASSSPNKRLKQPAVGVEAGGIKNRVLGSEKLRQGCFELLVDVLRAANEAHTRHPEAMLSSASFAAAMSAG